ncbi:site-specific integrase [Devosia sp.]|uniref:site-specific integrase n=1 Tax=Devosia sp. TaxID=1871048 RepID=UPI0025E7371B|nr:site-specific integrase [Devosia sp.]MCR6637109.1 site-specific integrase [Devosia sp.]
MPEMRAQLYRGTYCAVWSDEGKTRRRSLRTDDHEEAQRRLIDLRQTMAAPVGATVASMVQAYLDEKRGRVVDHERMVGGWKNAKSTFGHLRPDQITRELCRDYARRRRDEGQQRRGIPIGDGTILKEINVVRQALNWHGVQGAVFEAPSQPPPRDRYLTREEFQRLLDACASPHMRLFMILALSTAGRKGAILQLTWDRVDFERRQVRLAVPGEQNRKGRALVPMTDRLHAELLVAKKAALTHYVIEYAGGPVLNIKKGFAAAAKRAMLDDITPHDLRHTAAVWMAESGIAITEIAQFLGHTDPRITYRVYARFSPEYLRKAASALNV